MQRALSPVGFCNLPYFSRTPTPGRKRAVPPPPLAAGWSHDKRGRRHQHPLPFRKNQFHHRNGAEAKPKPRLKAGGVAASARPSHLCRRGANEKGNGSIKTPRPQKVALSSFFREKRDRAQRIRWSEADRRRNDDSQKQLAARTRAGIVAIRCLPFPCGIPIAVCGLGEARPLDLSTFSSPF